MSPSKTCAFSNYPNRNTDPNHLDGTLKPELNPGDALLGLSNQPPVHQTSQNYGNIWENWKMAGE